MGVNLTFGFKKFDTDNIDFIYDVYDSSKNRQYISICTNGKEYIKNTKLNSEFQPYTELLHSNLIRNGVEYFAKLSGCLINMDRIKDFQLEQENEHDCNLTAEMINDNKCCMYSGSNTDLAIELYNSLATQYNSYKNDNIHMLIQKNDEETISDAPSQGNEIIFDFFKNLEE